MASAFKNILNNFKPDGFRWVFALHIFTVCATCGILMIATPIKAQERPVLYRPSTHVNEIIPAWPKELVEMYDTIRIAFIGDVMQHGKQIRGALIPNTDPNKAESYDYSYAFKYIKGRLEKADIAVANMEFPVGLPPYSGYPQFSAPESIATEAIESGIDLFTIANNHLLDKGLRGIERTLQVYDSLGVHYTGAYACDSTEKADNPKIIELKGVKTAFINFTYGTNGFAVPSPFVINLMDSTKVKEVIARAKERGAQMIIALPHWGNEYEIYPSTKQKEWSEMLFNNGVQIIIGSHPHVPQSAELYLNHTLHPRKYGEIDKMVFYSLGNYISNQSIPDYTQLGMLVEIQIIKNNLSGEITLTKPNYEYIWCFKKDEFAPHYTVVPVNEFIDKEGLVRDKAQFERMKQTYNYILQKNLVREIH